MWDEPVPDRIELVWKRWHKELQVLRDLRVPCLYFPKDVNIKGMQLHGFCNASEVAYMYSAVVCLRVIDCEVSVHIHVALVMAKTKTTPIRQLSILRLEVYGAVILARLLCYVAITLEISISNIFAWMNSRVTLGMLQGNPRRFLALVHCR